MYKMQREDSDDSTNSSFWSDKESDEEEDASKNGFKQKETKMESVQGAMEDNLGLSKEVEKHSSSEEIVERFVEKKDGNGSTSPENACKATLEKEDQEVENSDNGQMLGQTDEDLDENIFVTKKAEKQSDIGGDSLEIAETSDDEVNNDEDTDNARTATKSGTSTGGSTKNKRQKWKDLSEDSSINAETTSEDEEQEEARTKFKFSSNKSADGSFSDGDKCVKNRDRRLENGGSSSGNDDTGEEVSPEIKQKLSQEEHKAALSDGDNCKNEKMVENFGDDLGMEEDTELSSQKSSKNVKNFKTKHEDLTVRAGENKSDASEFSQSSENASSSSDDVESSTDFEERVVAKYTKDSGSELVAQSSSENDRKKGLLTETKKYKNIDPDIVPTSGSEGGSGCKDKIKLQKQKNFYDSSVAGEMSSGERNRRNGNEEEEIQSKPATSVEGSMAERKKLIKCSSANSEANKNISTNSSSDKDKNNIQATRDSFENASENKRGLQAAITTDGTPRESLESRNVDDFWDKNCDIPSAGSDKNENPFGVDDSREKNVQMQSTEDKNDEVFGIFTEHRQEDASVSESDGFETIIKTKAGISRQGSKSSHDDNVQSATCADDDSDDGEAKTKTDIEDYKPSYNIERNAQKCDASPDDSEEIELGNLERQDLDKINVDEEASASVSPSTSLLTSGYGTYRSEKQDGGHSGEDDRLTITEFDKDSLYSFGICEQEESQKLARRNKFEQDEDGIEGEIEAEDEFWDGTTSGNGVEWEQGGGVEAEVLCLEKSEEDEDSSDVDVKFIDSEVDPSGTSHQKIYEKWEGNLRPSVEGASCLEQRLADLHLSTSVQHESENDLSHSESPSSESLSEGAFESYVRGMSRSQSDGDIRPKPKSFIRPVLGPTGPKKTDPVAKYFQYKQLWDVFKLPGENDRRALRWEIKERLAYQPPPPKPRKVLAPNTYTVPTEKKRSSLRWEIRNDLASGTLPHSYNYRF